jgi:DNA-binding beta-propeller fold protein YncE
MMTACHRTLASTALAALLLSLAAPGPARAADGPYVFKKDIPIGGEGGWDYLSVDVAARRLYVTHATRVVVIDLDTEAVIGEIADTPGVHGFAVAADLNRGFSSNGGENKASIVDLRTRALIASRDRSEP